MELQSDLSKKYIADALIHLMKLRDYSKITNKDITNKAGVSHITIYRNFKCKEDILKYYLASLFDDWNKNWSEEQNIVYNIFTFFQNNAEIITLLFKAKQEYLLIDNILSYCDYKDEDISIIAYSKISVAYLIFGWCTEWYKRGMIETPFEMSMLFEQS